MKAVRILILLLLLAALAAYFGWSYLHEAGNGHSLRLSGNIEVVEAQLGFKLAGRVIERPVDEGYQVSKGSLIALLETSDLRCDVALRTGELDATKAALEALIRGSRPQEIAAAEATMLRIKASLEELENGSRPQEIASAEAVLSSAKADMSRTEANFLRAKQLRQREAMAVEAYDAAKTAHEMAQAKLRDAAERLGMVREGPRQEQIHQARAALAQAQAQYELVKAGPRKEDVMQGYARVEQATAALGLAKVRLGYARLVSPMNGIVLSKNIEPGEYVSPGTPVVTVADVVNIWLRGYVSETDIESVKVGQRAVVTTDSKPSRKYEGRVSFISSQAEFTPKTVQTSQERVKLVYRVKIDIVNRNLQLKPGMPADAEILLDDPAGPPVAK